MIKKMTYCKRCVYPAISVNLDLDEEGVCSSCRTFEKFEELSDDFWEKRQKKLRQVIDETLKGNTSNYDCVIPVGGGKDSFYQTKIVIEELGLKPLLVTYHGNNYLPAGDFNRDLMRKAFDADHLVLGPGVETLKKLNRLCFRKMGDMNWHNHCGINTLPIIVATKFRIPLILWGDIAWDISGMYEPDDFCEFNARVRHEHDLRGFEWYDMINDPVEKISEKDMMWAKYPSDEEILDVGTRGIYLGNFYKWDPNQFVDQLVKDYGWMKSEVPFERTYRTMSNLDDRYENGVHDLLKFVKFGYGRASDHASKDVRMGYMNRDEAIEKVRTLDSVVSSDLYHWLDYVGMTEDEFWRVADTFRDPRVWSIENGQWVKDNVWGEKASYGAVHLPAEAQEKYKS